MRALVLLLLIAAPAAADDRERRARALVEQATLKYNLAEYDAAIEAYKAAYELTPRPSLLYNIAQSYRLKGDCAHAVPIYKNYLRAEPGSPNKARIEGFLQHCVSEPPPAAEKPAPVDTPAPVEKPAPPPEPAPVIAPAAIVAPAPVVTREAPRPSKRQRALRIAGLTLVGAGIVSLAVAIYFSVDAGRAASDVQSLYQMPRSWDDGKSLQARGQNDLIGEAILYTTGALFAAGGAALAGVGWRAQP